MIKPRGLSLSCSVEFEENDGPQVAQPNVSSEDVEIPQEAIGRMGVGFFCPIEGHLVADQEELCSTQVEPFSSQHNQANGTNISPSQEQSQDPSLVDQVASQEPSSPSHDASHDQGQDYHLFLLLKILMLIKATTPVKTGTQLIKMIKIILLATMRKSKPVVKQE